MRPRSRRRPRLADDAERPLLRPVSLPPTVDRDPEIAYPTGGVPRGRPAGCGPAPSPPWRGGVDRREMRRRATGGVWMAVLQAIGVRKTFDAGDALVRALRGVDLTVDHGEFVAIVGPSGCGKSTLLNLVAGLDTPTGGEIVGGGESLFGQDESALARLRRAHVGFVFQFFNLLDDMTAFENVVLPAAVAGQRRAHAERRARDLLDLLGLADKARDLPAFLSGGQRQRLAIARALAN